ncbi:uncharacterized protein LOC143041464 [Oratosquilla oratoria]|uniref:uncharacterized protein LOC143041464 n=1 Tax=Oratosquilla oratoria TaxID=337810 RepID=UPI003F762B50
MSAKVKRNNKSVNYAAFMDDSEDEDFMGFSSHHKNKSIQGNAQASDKSPKQMKKSNQKISDSPEVSTHTSAQEQMSGRKAPAKRLSLEEKLFQRELEAVLKMSKIEGGVNGENSSDDEFKSDSFSKPVSQTPPSSSENKAKASASSRSKSCENDLSEKKTIKRKENRNLESEIIRNGDSQHQTNGKQSESELCGVFMNGDEPVPSTSWGWTGKRQRKKVSFAEVDSYCWEDESYENASEDSSTSSPKKKKKKEPEKKKSPRKSQSSKEVISEKEDIIEDKSSKSSIISEEIAQERGNSEETPLVNSVSTENSENESTITRETNPAGESLSDETSDKFDKTSDPLEDVVVKDETPEKITGPAGRRNKKAVIIDEDSDDWDEESDDSILSEESDDSISSEESDFAPSPKKKTKGKKEQVKKETKVTKATTKESAKGKGKKAERKSISPKNSTVKTTKVVTSPGQSPASSKASAIVPKRILQKENTVPKSTKGTVKSSQSSVGTKSSLSTTSSPSPGRVPVGLVKTPFRSPLLNDANRGTISPVSSKTTPGVGVGIGLRLGLSRRSGGKPLHPSLILK